MTIEQFCTKYKLTKEERRLCGLFLASYRHQKTIELFNIGTKKNAKNN